MRYAIALGIVILTFFAAIILVAARRAHAEEEHRHQCRRISEVGDDGNCCKVRDPKTGLCTSKGRMICYELACKVCGESCTPTCSGCM